MPSKRSRLIQSMSRLISDCTKYGGFPEGCLSPTSPLDVNSFTTYSGECGGVALGLLVALDHKQNQALSVVSAMKSGRREDDGGKLRRCKPAGFDDSGPSALSTFEPANFLYACYLCRRRLSHGKDIYMYRGDKAFCSEECRYHQIVSDERKERCPSSASAFSSSSYVSSSPMFTIVSEL